MIISYQYRIKPNKKQRKIIDNTLDMLRCQYNYQLAQRFNWYEQNRCSIDRCSLLCHLPELANKPNYYNQKASLTQLKKDRPWYKTIHSQVLQEVPKKIELAFGGVRHERNLILPTSLIQWHAKLLLIEHG